MPYDVPHPVTDAAILAAKIGWVERTAYVDMALYGTITKTGGVDAIPGLAAGGISAFKLSTYEYDAVRFPRIDHPTMLAAFREIAKTGLPVAIHNEDQELVEMLTAQARAEGRIEPIMHCRTRPPLAETMADLEIFEMALETGAHVHIAHSSLARGFEIAETFRTMGAQTTGEACIQYLCMTEDDIVRLGGKGKCNPPFRTADEVERMWQCLTAGKIAYVSTDHAPWPIERKTLPDIFANGAGLTGMQSFAPLMFSLLAERGLPPTLMAMYCAERSARMHGLWPRKGAIRVGSDADLCVLERGEFVFDEAAIQDRPEMRWSPYHGRMMRARVAATYLRGVLVWDGTAVLARPGNGKFVRRQTRPA
jgi:allantoinase